jgi:hypothetical protein
MAIAAMVGMVASICVAGCSKDRKAGDQAGSAKDTPGTEAPGTEPAGAPGTEPAPGAQAGDPGQPGAAVARTDRPGPPLYYDRALTRGELRKRSLRELSLMRNTIFALGGNTFRKSWLREHFGAQPCYQSRDTLDKSKISDIDWANVKLIAEVERSFDTSELEARKAALLSAIGAGEPTAEQRVELELLSTRLGKWVGPESVAQAKRSPLEDPSRLDAILTLAQIEDMSRRDLRLLRNTIYARRGYPFKSPILDDYFEGMDWYQVDSDYTDKRLTSVDWKNIKLIKSVEETLGGPISDNEHGHEIGWFDGA